MAHRSSTFLVAVLAMATSTAGCAKRHLDAADNPDVAGKYRDKN